MSEVPLYKMGGMAPLGRLDRAAALRTLQTSALHLVLLFLLTPPQADTETHPAGRLGCCLRIEPKVLQASAPIVVQASWVVLGRGSGILLPRHLSRCL